MPVTCHTQYDNTAPETLRRKQVTPTNGSGEELPTQSTANHLAFRAQIIDNNLIVSFDSKSVLYG